MPSATYTPLANITLGSSAASVTFSSISGSYRDLILIFNGNSTSGADLKVLINGSTSAIYNSLYMRGTGSAEQTVAYSSQNAQVIKSTGNDTSVSVIKLEFLDYSATDKHKSYLIRDNGPSNWGVGSYAGRWASTAAITSIAVTSDGANIAAGSTLALYGIAA